MLVKDMMTSDPVTIGSQESLQVAQEKMMKVGSRRLPVVDDGQLVGIVTDRDIRLAVNSPLVMHERWQDEMLLKNTPVMGCMSTEVVSVNPDMALEEATELMLAKKFSGLPVVTGQGVLIGILTVSDVMRALVNLLRKDK